MMKNNVVYCEKCDTIEVGTYDLECGGVAGCGSKRLDLGLIEYVEDAIWIGMKYNNSCLIPSLEWQSQGMMRPGNKKVDW
jgi:hypothetical protein